MINMLKLKFMPGACQWIHRPGAAIQLVAVAQRDAGSIHVFAARSAGETLAVLDHHRHPVISMQVWRVGVLVEF